MEKSVKINFVSFALVGNGSSSVDHHIVGEVRMKIGVKLARQINLLDRYFPKKSLAKIYISNLAAVRRWVGHF